MGQRFSKLFSSRNKRGKQPVSTAAVVVVAPDEGIAPPSKIVPASQTNAPAHSSAERPAAVHFSGQPTPNQQSTSDPSPSAQGILKPNPGGHRVNSGIYTITNKYHRHVVYLEDANDRSPLKGHHNPEIRGARWHVRNYGKHYSIENVDHDRYAYSGNRADVNAHVEGNGKERLWRIQALPTGEYTIATTDTGNLWMLPDDEPGTPVELSDVYTDQRCWWSFNSAEAAAPVDEAPTPRPVPPTSEPLLIPPGDQRIPEGAIVEFISVTAEAPDLLQPLGAACEALRVVLEWAKALACYPRYPYLLTQRNAQNFGHGNEDQKTLVKRLKFHLATVKSHIAQLEEDRMIDEKIPALSQDVRKSLKTYARALKEIPELLLVSQPEKSSLVNTATSITLRIDEAFQKYTTSLHLFVSSAIDQMRQHLGQFRQESGKANTAAEKARQIQPTAYGVQHRGCLPGTREKTLLAISKWVDDETPEKGIFFFLDAAGSGKSTVAKHMTEKWKGENRLLARFFFSRDTTATMSTDSFCSTVAGAYADLDQNYKLYMDKFMARPNVELLSFGERFEGLVARPLRAIGRPAILIIDALDECHPEQRDQMLEALRNQHSSIPLLRVFVTGRPERDIKRWANDKFGFGYTNFSLLEESDKDVELYIKHRLKGQPIARDRLYPVIRQAEGLFIWARVACDLLLDCDDIDSLLEELGKEVSLDYLYKVALEQSMPKEGASRRAMVLVLQMILAARKPLSISELEILSPKRDVVEKVVMRLGSVLLYRGRDDPIRLLHATFREFLTARSKDNIFFIQPELGHHTLASGCLNTINYLSKQEHTTLRNVDRISNREMISYLAKILIDSVSRTFMYSSESWVYHCSMSYRKLALNEQILEFANGGLETWIDVVDNWQGLGVQGCVRNVLLLLRQKMSPQVTEMLVSRSLRAIVRA